MAAQAALTAAGYEVIAIGQGAPESVSEIKDYTEFAGAVYVDADKELPVYKHLEMRFRNKTNCWTATKWGLIGTARGIWLAQIKGRKGLVKGLEKVSFLVRWTTRVHTDRPVHCYILSPTDRRR